MPKKATKTDEIETPEITDDGFIPLVEAPEEVVEPEAPEEEEASEETPKDTPGEIPKEVPEEEPAAFKFADQDEPQKPFMVIKHQGREVPIFSEEEARNYMQKGFDYDFKVGPHGKLAKILDEYPDFAKQVAQNWDSYATGKQAQPASKPELKSLDEFENPNDWFWENYSKVRQFEDTAKPAPVPKQEVPSWVSAIVTHDPENFNEIARLVPQYAERVLTKAQYDRVNNDLPSLVQFYDWVKTQVLQTKKEPVPTANEPAFRIKSGGGEAPAAEKPPWETKNNDEFEKYMAKVKGIASY